MYKGIRDVVILALLNFSEKNSRIFVYVLVKCDPTNKVLQICQPVIVMMEVLNWETIPSIHTHDTYM